MHSTIAALVVSAASILLGYSQATGNNEACVSGVCDSRGLLFSKDVVTTSCAFSFYANPSSSVFSPTIISNSRCNNPSSAKICSSRAFLPSVHRTLSPGIRSASIGFTIRAASSTSSSIEPRSDNEETIIEQQQSNPKEPNERLVIIIGGTGFLGTEIRNQLQERGMKYIATTTPATYRNMSEKDKFVPLDLTSENAQQDFYDIISTAVQGADGTSFAKEVAVIAAMGTIGKDDDQKVNAALAEAIKGAHRVNVDNGGKEEEEDDVVKSFVMIGNTKRVRRLARQVSFLKGYAEGKDEAEATLQDLFGKNACIIKVSGLSLYIVSVCLHQQFTYIIIISHHLFMEAKK